jgi:NADH:ubiquinone oxidoreductase subunit D
MYRETQILNDSTAQLAGPDGGDMVINVGPQHPATHVYCTWLLH